MRFDDVPIGLTFDDVLLIPQRSSIRSRGDVDIKATLSRNITLDIPMIAANMDTVCEHEMAAVMAKLGGIGIIHRFMTIEAHAAQIAKVSETGLLVGGAVGTDHDMTDRARALVEAGAKVLVLDIAHGHADHAIEGTKRLKDTFADVDVIAGNVATREGAEELASAGADAIKVGVGPGGVCTTRLVAGVGVPQLTAIDEVRGIDIPLVADGGIKNSGDIAKALAAGGDTVMIGSLLAGTKESPGEFEQGSEGLRKRVRGMASFEAIEARAARQGEDIDDEYFEQRAPEGVDGSVPYRGEASKVVWQLMAGLRSAMSYTNARSIDELHQRARFVRVTPLGYNESTPHATTRY